MAEMVGGNPELLAHERHFLDGSRRGAVVLKSAVVGWGEYLPGWKWSEHAGKQTGRPSLAHIGYLLCGQMKIIAADGQESLVSAGEAFEVGPGHDAWVVGRKSCVALDFEQLDSAVQPNMEQQKP